MKINTKFQRGDNVLTPISDRPGQIESLLVYHDTWVRYKVILQFPMRNKTEFKQVDWLFEEKELTKID